MTDVPIVYRVGARCWVNFDENQPVVPGYIEIGDELVGDVPIKSPSNSACVGWRRD